MNCVLLFFQLLNQNENDPFCYYNGIAPLCWHGTVNDDQELDAHNSRFDNRNKRSPKQDE